MKPCDKKYDKFGPVKKLIRGLLSNVWIRLQENSLLNTKLSDFKEMRRVHCM